MNFNSITYAVFPALVVALHFWIPQRYRWILLLAASYCFYMSWNAKYAVLLIASTLIDWVASIWLEAAGSRGNSIFSKPSPHRDQGGSGTGESTRPVLEELAR